MEGVVAGERRIVLTITLYQGDRRDAADETEGRGVEDERVGGRELLDQRRHADPVALIRLAHAVTERRGLRRVVDEVEPVGERVETDHVDVDHPAVRVRRERLQVREAAFEEVLLAVEEREHDRHAQ